MTDALRYNDGKPELSYLLTFPNTPWASLVPLWSGAIETLRDWYVGECVCYGDVVCRFVEMEFHVDWPEAVARVSTYGGTKYDRGNYLAGMPWDTVVCCLLRHCLKDGSTPKALRAQEGRLYPWRHLDDGPDGSGLPHYGHVMWNVLYLGYLVESFPDQDNRIKAPAA